MIKSEFHASGQALLDRCENLIHISFEAVNAGDVICVNSELQKRTGTWRWFTVASTDPSRPMAMDGGKINKNYPYFRLVPHDVAEKLKALDAEAREIRLKKEADAIFFRPVQKVRSLARNRSRIPVGSV